MKDIVPDIVTQVMPHGAGLTIPAVLFPFLERAQLGLVVRRAHPTSRMLSSNVVPIEGQRNRKRDSQLRLPSLLLVSVKNSVHLANEISSPLK